MIYRMHSAFRDIEEQRFAADSLLRKRLCSQQMDSQQPRDEKVVAVVHFEISIRSISALITHVI